MDYPITMNETGMRRIVASYFHTPGKGYRHLFHSVLRAGHIRVAPDDRLESWSYPGHDLLLCVAGAGAVRIGRRFSALPSGAVCWVDYRRQPVFWPDRTEPWEILWMRVDSAQMDLIAEALNVEGNPVFMPRDVAAASAAFTSILRLLHERPLTIDAALHAAVSSVIAILFDARHCVASARRHALRPERVTDLGAVLNTMRVEYRRRWRVEDLAKLAGVSVPQFFRTFNRATGSSPMDWLRRERVNQAKRRLAETSDRVRDIAEHVGYGDPLYFSRDFKKLVGVSPEHYRRQEQAKAPK